MEMFGEDGRDGVWTVMANVTDPESLHRAFDGCAGVFHTSAFVDPGGMSGYTVSAPNSVPNLKILATTTPTYVMCSLMLSQKSLSKLVMCSLMLSYRSH
jgi:hypothetical protein